MRREQEDRGDPGTPRATLETNDRGKLIGVSDRPDLAAFLRARREQLRPADVGLRDTGRRRTPGLRREEVATLAGVSVDYLMRLEQGRDLNPSAAVVMALATALQLSESERMHIAKLAAISSSPEMCPGSSELIHDVAPTVQLIIDRLDPTPAFVIGPAGDFLAWNLAWRSLVEPLGFLEGRTANLVAYVFTHGRARDVFPDWSRTADEQVSRLRSAALRWGEDARFTALVDHLRNLPEFAKRWSTHSVADKQRGIKRIVHPNVGELRFSFETMHLPDDGDQQLITWFPADDSTDVAVRNALANAAPAGSSRLRVVREA